MEETLYTTDLIQLLTENGIVEDIEDLKFGVRYPIVWGGESTFIVLEGVSYGTYEDLYTVTIGEKD